MLITACILLGFLFSARAFFPTNVRTLGEALGKSHEKITNEAITELDQEFFGNNKPTSTMEAAIKEIVRANEKVDDDQKTAAKHFDGESLPEGQGLILDLRESVIMALQKNDADGARTALGRALHTIQDFYSTRYWLSRKAAHPGRRSTWYSPHRLGLYDCDV